MTRSDLLRVGTRGSALATTQTQWVVDLLTGNFPGLRIETVIVKTTGDIHSQEGRPQPLSKGLFTRELETALMAGTVDIAVHSLKDLPTELPDGMELGAVTTREDPRDALIGRTLAELRANPSGVSIGTSSLRRAAQLRAALPGCRVVNLQGNVDTRLRKVREGAVDCAVMAAAGLTRLGRRETISDFIDTETMLPAPAQGALGIEIRAGDSRVRDIVSTVHCAETAAAVAAERAFLHGLGGGCRAPVAALAGISGGALELRGRIISLDGGRTFDGSISDVPERAVAAGMRLADRLAAEGAREVLDMILSEARVTSDSI